MTPRRLSAPAALPRFSAPRAGTGAIVAENYLSTQFNLTAGQYRLEFDAGGSAFDTGTYSFKLFKVPTPQTFNYTLGNLVEKGLPAAGAGNLETIASVDRYRFTVEAGQGGDHRYVHVAGLIPYKIIDTATGDVMGTGDGQGNKTFELWRGTYRIDFAASDTTGGYGTYSFRFRKVA